MKWFMTFILFVGATNSAQAFNWQRCTSQQWNGGGIIGMTSSIFSSTGQFTSSTGDCSPLVADHSVKLFIAQNHESLKTDLSRKHGESLITLVYLTGMTPIQMDKLLAEPAASTALQSNDFEGFFKILQMIKNS